eukprot:156382-Pyramimonas_sp.AAC.1
MDGEPRKEIEPQWLQTTQCRTSRHWDGSRSIKGSTYFCKPLSCFASLFACQATGSFRAALG